jgi:hypothetical protein
MFYTVSSIVFRSQGPILKPMRYIRSAPLLAVCLLWSPAIAAAGQTPQTTSELPPNPQVMVQEVVQNGLRQVRNDPLHWSFREIVRKDGRVETREVCQTNAGTIDRLVAINGQPLSPEQQKREDTRVQELLANGSEIRRERQKQREDSARQSRMFATFPDAFRYKYAGTEGSLVKLAFEPNPQFVPSSRQEEVFHHLEGTMWIDPNQEQFTRIDGRLTSEVRFAGGLLGHLDKGGVFSVRFKEVSSGHWVTAALDVEMNGRALLFKTIAVQEQREFDDYRRVPDDLSLQQAAELLEKEPNSSPQSAANTAK